MTLIDILRAISMVVWLGVGISRLTSFVRIFKGNYRYFDQLGALISATGFLFAAFSLRWYLPESVELFAGLYAFSTLLAVSFFRTLWRYEGAAK
ncbi:hypothetical protein [Sphingomonas sp. NFX23]|uniref:hypothetical protein n=1 Tax=Sphingomonas sp. NFX23 TaxID=2819532 RepID=UPI003CF3A012